MHLQSPGGATSLIIVTFSTKSINSTFPKSIWWLKHGQESNNLDCFGGHSCHTELFWENRRGGEPQNYLGHGQRLTCALSTKLKIILWESPPCPIHSNEDYTFPANRPQIWMRTIGWHDDFNFIKNTWSLVTVLRSVMMLETKSTFSSWLHLPCVALTADESPLRTSRKKSGGLLWASHSYPEKQCNDVTCHSWIFGVCIIHISLIKWFDIQKVQQTKYKLDLFGCWSVFISFTQVILPILVK